MPLKRTRQFTLHKKREAFTAILRFMTKEDVSLTIEEEKILGRWIFCDALLRQKLYNEDTIIEKLIEAYTISKFTARNDINYTQRLFSKSRSLIKKYLIHLHLERIDSDIQNARQRIFTTDIDEKTGKVVFNSADPKELIALAKLHEVYTYTLNSIPEEQDKDIMPPPIFQFILAPGQVINRAMELEEALKKADIIIMKEANGIFIADE